MAPEQNPAPIPAQIMVVEDDVMVRTAIAEALRAAGLQVIEAASGDEAWNFLLSGSHVDIIFSDVQMPGSIDGVSLAKRVKENYPAITVILTSGGPLSDPAAYPHFFAKPYRLANVVAMITSLLEKQ